eukprot:6923937-Lingulodinium_polyedra.AAC.1
MAHPTKKAYAPAEHSVARGAHCGHLGRSLRGARVANKNNGTFVQNHTTVFLNEPCPALSASRTRTRS